MLNFKFRRIQHYLFIACILIFASACKKDKVPEPIPLPVPTKWDIIPGTYKVYDSTGTEYLYQMEIKHKIGYNIYGIQEDSLTFENFDGEFTFTSHQVDASNYPEFFIRIGNQALLYDSEMHRWKILTAANDDFVYNVFHNDTINLIFRKTNINYYLVDNTPYFSGTCKQIAVKQH